MKYSLKCSVESNGFGTFFLFRFMFLRVKLNRILLIAVTIDAHFPGNKQTFITWRIKLKFIRIIRAGRIYDV